MSCNDFGSDDSMADPSFEIEVNDNSADPSLEIEEYNINTTLNSTESLSGNNEEFNFDMELAGVLKVIFNGKFFKIVKKLASTPYQKKMQGILAICQTCSMKVKGSLRVTSNFVTHLRKMHPTIFKDFQKEKSESRQNTGVRSSFNKNVLSFLCDTCSPLSMVERPSFLNLFPGKKIPSRRTFTRMLSESHQKFVQELSAELSTVEYICTTADLWSGGKKSFFGYTCHWLEAKTLKRQSAALACRRFKGVHNFEKIADVIREINGLFDIPVTKIVYTITDNGSNFVKAFKEFGVTMRKKLDDSESEISSDDEQQSMIEPEFHSYTPLLSKHFRCATHTLNLLATTDFTKVLQSNGNLELQMLHKTSFNRSAKIWNKCNRPKTAEIIKEVLNCQLPTPCDTRWNSLYDAVQKLLEHQVKLPELCYKLGVPTFEDYEIQYLQEYSEVMRPIAEAIDFLQRENNMFFGFFIPTLVSIKIKMRRLDLSNLKFLEDVNFEMRAQLQRRFEKYFCLQPESWDALIAAVVIPELKLKFCKVLLQSANTYSIEDIKCKLHEYANEFVPNGEKMSSQPSSSNKNNFLEFEDEPAEVNRVTPRNRTITEITLYLADDDENIESLHRYPVVLKLFLKYNTPLPSSAPVERLFSFAGIINRSARQNLNDLNFENLVLKKANER